MKALNRKEVLVNAKANGTLDSFKPLTRDEAFAKKALGLGGGASSWNDLTDKPFFEEVKTVSVEVPTDNGLLPHFPKFAVGDVVNITVDGVELSLTADVIEGEVGIVGDDWAVLSASQGVLYWGEGTHTVEYIANVITPLDRKYLPPTVVTFNTDVSPMTASMYSEEIVNLMYQGVYVYGNLFGDIYHITGMYGDGNGGMNVTFEWGHPGKPNAAIINVYNDSCTKKPLTT